MYIIMLLSHRSHLLSVLHILHHMLGVLAVLVHHASKYTIIVAQTVPMKMVSVASISTLNYQVERTVRRMLRRGSDISGDEVTITFYSFLHIIYIIFLLKATNRFQDYLAVNQEAAMVFLMECRDQVIENI